MQVYEVEEYGEVGIPVERLFVDGEFTLDERIEKKGYLTVTLAGGRLKLKATRFVGVIPLNKNVSLRVVPRATVANLNRMLVKSGNLPTVIEGFSRGYKPSFAENDKTIAVYHRSLLSSVAGIVEKGIVKDYISAHPPPKWRGRLLVSETVNRFAARGIRYDGVFDFKTLSHDVPLNQVLKAALTDVLEWLKRQNGRIWFDKVMQASSLLSRFSDVSDLTSHRRHLVGLIPRLAGRLTRHTAYYSEAVWTAYAILQGSIPDLGETGYASLDSMIVDASEIFEGYVRRVIQEHARDTGFRVLNGNIEANSRRFFAYGDGQYSVHPDIIVESDGAPIAVLDAKYKPMVKEQDRYELLAFMESFGVSNGAFICPQTNNAEPSRLLGTTSGGKRMGIIRINLAADEAESEERALFESVAKVLAGRYDF